ncbi:MAG: epoxyqueuosine reductase [Armatimonadota bacterium]|nr:MAG: epoxyqueuosine reductase [Armatimonadota bacterium]
MAQASEVIELAAAIKQLAGQHGAALVGIAPVERFDPLPPLHDAAPGGSDPRDFLPEARSVISIAQPILNPVMDAPAVLADRELAMIPPHAKRPYLEALYGRVGHFVHDVMLESIGQVVGQYLLSQGYDAMIFPTTGLHPRVEGLTEQEIWEGPSREWADKYSPLRHTSGPFSHRHAATRAGLGEFGYNNLVLTREFGPRQRFNSIVTDAELTPDPLIAEPICLRDRCRLCLDACIMACITMRDDPAVVDYRSVEKDDRARIFIDTPARTDAPLCQSRRRDRADAPIRGDCVRICPIPRPPKHLPARLREIVERSNFNSA